MITKTNPLVLIILDGWGLNPERTGNAIRQAHTPNMDMLGQNYPHAALQAAGISAGLYWGDSGNSEVGHLSIGTGRILYQNFPRISMAIDDGSFFENKVILEAVERAKINKKPLHLMGLVSDAGTHSHIDHLFALIKAARDNKVPIRIHFFSDGRDTDTKIAMEYALRLKEDMEDMPDAKIATIIGRSIAMDRNSHWDLIQEAYECLTEGKGETAKTTEEAIKNSYKKGITDEFIKPIRINPDKSDLIDSGSSVVFFNFREDRARQLAKAFIKEDFNEFPRKKIENLYFATMVEYEKGLGEHIIFSSRLAKDSLAEILSKNGLAQLHIAETEKYAHVTYFFNGGVEEPHKGEDWRLIPSRPDGNYKDNPHMSASQIAFAAAEALEKDKYDFILVNFANPDMVGHTGNLKACIDAIEEIDRCIGQILEAGQKKDAAFIITADHGNAECKIDIRTREPQTDHTANPVPIYFITPNNSSPQRNPDFDYSRSIGFLADIAPTVLEYFGIPKSAEMTGESLMEKLT